MWRLLRQLSHVSQPSQCNKSSPRHPRALRNDFGAVGSQGGLPGCSGLYKMVQADSWRTLAHFPIGSARPPSWPLTGLPPSWLGTCLRRGRGAFPEAGAGRSAASVCRQVFRGGTSNGTRKPDTPREQTLSSMVHKNDQQNSA